jgi:glucose/arabinose dehydrogenase
MKALQDVRLSLALGVLVARSTLAATCPNLKASYATPIVGDGWQATLIAQDLTSPRSILFDSNGALLVVESGAGVAHLALTDGGGGCITVASKTMLIKSPDVSPLPSTLRSLTNFRQLNHGIALSKDGKTLYASSSNDVFAWTYDASGPFVGTANQSVVTGMTNDDHTTRTLLMSNKQDGMLLVSRGSNSNIDIEAESIETGHSQIKAFNMNNVTSTTKPYEFVTEGRLLGWGLRNSVGVAEEPLTGGIYSVENSADDVVRDGIDVHQNNPGEEMNFHGFLNASTENQGGNYGYPVCYALWNTSIPALGNLTIGSQFTLEQNDTVNDNLCASEHVPPRLTFQAHMAPLDIIFLPNGTKAFVSFHGSW